MKQFLFATVFCLIPLMAIATPSRSDGNGPAHAYFDEGTPSVMHIELYGKAAEAIYENLQTPERKDAELPTIYKAIPDGFFCSKSFKSAGPQFICLLKVDRK